MQRIVTNFNVYMQLIATYECRNMSGRYVSIFNRIVQAYLLMWHVRTKFNHGISLVAGTSFSLCFKPDHTNDKSIVVLQITFHTS